MGGGMTILTLPRLGETMEEARVTEWLKAPGEGFRRGDVLLEVETDKTVVEVPALQDGTLIAHLVVPGEMVALDQPIAEVSVAGVSVGVSAAPPATQVIVEALTVVQGVGRSVPTNPALMRPAASPKARAAARVSGVDLGTVVGSGRRGRITGADVASAQPVGRDPVQTDAAGITLRRFAAVPGGRTGAPVVLLHGLYDEGAGWRDLPQRLARAGHPVLVPDLPGHGASAATAADVEAMTDTVRDLLAGVLPEGPMRIVGHSMGAVIATRLALLLGDRVESLTLISPAGLGPRINPDFMDLMAHAETPATLSRALGMLGAGPLSGAALHTELDRLLRRRPGLAPMVRSLARAGIQQIDIAPDLARLRVPVTAIFGLADAIIDWRDCASLPARAAIHLVPDAGHLPHSTAPDLICDLIVKGASSPQTFNGTAA